MKIRVYQLARDLKLSPQELMDMVQSFGVEVPNHMASLDEAVVERVKERIAEAKSTRGATRPVAARPAAAAPSAVRTAEAAAPPSAPPSAPVPPTSSPTPAPASAPAPTPPRTAPVEPPAERKRPEPVPPTVRPVISRTVNPPASPVTSDRGAGGGARPGSRGPGGGESYPRGGSDRNNDGGRGRDSGPGAGGRAPAPAAAPRPGPSLAPQDTGERPLGPSRIAHVGASNPSRVALPATRPALSKSERRKKKKRSATVEEIRANVKRTLSSLDAGRGRKRRRRGVGPGAADESNGPIRIHEYATVAELASVVNVKPAEVIGVCLQLGLIANINRQLEKEEIELVLAEFGHEAEFVTEYGAERIQEEEVASEETFDLLPRAPIVTVMGHVDHGKTTLLDNIRKSRVTESESGGITQHIGAYRVETSKGTITFLDTPGHEAFTAMRARGARITDLVILVVAANDSVRPQTIEAVNHAKAAGVPLVVAINKIDVNGANPDAIRKGLADAGVLVETWGGQVVDVEIAAKHGLNMERLLDLVAIEAELLELKAAPDRPAKGAVVESRRDPGKGVVATVLVQDGTLHIGDAFVCGAEFGRVRAMNDENGKRVREAGPSTPVEVLGWDGVPMAGDTLVVMKNEAKAREIASHRAQIARTHQHRLSGQRTSLFSVHERIRAGELQELNIILKADVGGSVEVLRDTLEALTTAEVKVRVIHMGVGLISEADVNLAMASGAIIIGFHTRTDPRAHQLALSESVDIRIYEVIYDVEKEVKAAMSGLLAPEEVERPTGSAQVRQVFSISRVGTIAGCMVLSGTIHRNDKARVYRGTEVVFTGTLSSLKRHKDDVKEVASGFECGIGLDGFDTLIEGDVIEAFTIEQVARTIS